MLDFDMFRNLMPKKMLSYTPYAVIAYLLFGGAGIPESYDFDMQASSYVMKEVAEPQIEQSSAFTEMYHKVLGQKQPDPNQNLPGKAAFSGANQRKDEPAPNGFSTFIKQLFDLPSKIVNPTHYGY